LSICYSPNRHAYLSLTIGTLMRLRSRMCELILKDDECQIILKQANALKLQTCQMKTSEKGWVWCWCW